MSYTLPSHPVSKVVQLEIDFTGRPRSSYSVGTKTRHASGVSDTVRSTLSLHPWRLRGNEQCPHRQSHDRCTHEQWPCSPYRYLVYNFCTNVVRPITWNDAGLGLIEIRIGDHERISRRLSKRGISLDLLRGSWNDSDFLPCAAKASQ